MTAGLLLPFAAHLACVPAYAQNFTVQSGQTVGPQDMNNAGDVGIIEPGGTVNGGAVTAVDMNNDDQRLDNGGLITTSGIGSHGIFSTGANAWISNGGAITTSGDAGRAIVSQGANAWISNGGAITPSGINSPGIFSTGANAWISNGGSITTSGTGADGIFSTGANAWISNCGTIHVSGNNAVGIFSSGANGQVTNCGTVISVQDNAIEFSGAQDNILTLLPGTVLQGGLVFGGGMDTLNVGNGLSIAMTFDKQPEILQTYGAPFAASGNQVAVVDPTNLSVQDEVLTDTLGGIFSSVQNRLNGFANGGVSGVTSNPRPSYVGGAKSAHSAMVDDPYRQGWVQGFGSYRLQRGQEGPVVDTDIRLGGVVSGLDGATGAGGRAGMFFGGSWGEIEAQYDSQETDVESVFGGAYARWLKGDTFIDVAMTLGYSDYDRERRVANNLAAGGLQLASADYDGWFISPEVTFTRPKWDAQQRLEKSLTLRYAGLFLDGFTETGAAAPLSVNDRDIHVLQARTQLTMPVVHEGADGSRRSSAFYVGLEGRANVGDEDVSGALLAQNISFDPGGDDVVGGAFAGLQFERTSSGGTTLYGSIEGQVETGGGRQASAKGGVRFRF